MKIKVGDIQKEKNPEVKTKGDNNLTDHLISFLGSTIHNVEDQYTPGSNLQAPLGITPNLVTRYQENKESNDLFAKYETHKNRVVENLRRRLL